MEHRSKFSVAVTVALPQAGRLRERGEETQPSIEMAAKLAEVLNVSLDYLVLGKTDVTVDQSLLDKVLTIQLLPEEDREHIKYTLDSLIQHAKTRLAYEK